MADLPAKHVKSVMERVAERLAKQAEASTAQDSDRASHAADADSLEVRQWAEAHDLASLGDLTALWLEGGIKYTPFYAGDGPDRETDGLVPLLAAANRSGFLTDWSQPGRPMDKGSAQRATVGGHCSEGLARRIAEGCLATELVVLSYWPGCEDEMRVPVTIDEGDAFTFAGGVTTMESLAESLRGSLNATALHDLLVAWQVTVFDPRWGRNDLLWPTLASVLELRMDG